MILIYKRGGGNGPSTCFQFLFSVFYASVSIPLISGLFLCPMKLNYKIKLDNQEVSPKPVTSNSIFPVYDLF